MTPPAYRAVRIDRPAALVSALISAAAAGLHIVTSGSEESDTGSSLWKIFIIFCLTALLYCLYELYQFLFRPMNRIVLPSTLGYMDMPGWSKRDVAQWISKWRKVGDIPPVYPNGWYCAIESRDLPKGVSRQIFILGQSLAAFRDETGEAFILDATCPHLGANLACGGIVVGSSLQCPFHGWRYRGRDGICDHIPVLPAGAKIPEKAKVKSWITHELNGIVHIWFDAEGREPWWTVPELSEITSGNWSYRGRTEHYMNTHIEEIPENGGDVAHFATVHTDSAIWGIGKHVWDGKWDELPAPDGHISALRLKHDLNVLGKNIPIASMDVIAYQIGPAIVHLEWENSFGTGVYTQYLMPMEPLMQKVVHQIWCSYSIPTVVAKFMIFIEALQVERDIYIWNNKQYMKKPMMARTAEDALLMRHRRWYQQFYSENSPRINNSAKPADDW